jgi:hypothetical protein
MLAAAKYLLALKSKGFIWSQWAGVVMPSPAALQIERSFLGRPENCLPDTVHRDSLKREKAYEWEIFCAL